MWGLVVVEGLFQEELRGFEIPVELSGIRCRNLAEMSSELGVFEVVETAVAVRIELRGDAINNSFSESRKLAEADECCFLAEDGRESLSSAGASASESSRRRIPKTF